MQRNLSKFVAVRVGDITIRVSCITAREWQVAHGKHCSSTRGSLRVSRRIPSIFMRYIIMSIALTDLVEAGEARRLTSGLMSIRSSRTSPPELQCLSFQLGAFVSVVLCSTSHLKAAGKRLHPTLCRSLCPKIGRQGEYGYVSCQNSPPPPALSPIPVS